MEDCFCCIALACIFSCSSLVIRQKSESQNGGNKKAKYAKFSEKRTFFTPWYAHVRTCAYQGVRNARYLENLACFAFLLTPFWDSPFCLIADDLYWPIIHRFFLQITEQVFSKTPVSRWLRIQFLRLFFPIMT